MQRLIITCALLVPAVACADPGGQPQNLIYLSEDVPIFIRLAVQIDGGSYEAPWRKYVDQFFANLDKDGDGVLKDAETLRIPSTMQLAQLGLRSSASDASVQQLTGKVTKQELDEYLRRATGGPFTVNMGRPSQGLLRSPVAWGQQAGQAVNLFAKLDRDKDGKLSADECRLTTDLRKLDLDDDESLSGSELRPTSNPYVVYRAANTRTVPNSGPIVLIGEDASRAQVARRLLKKYDSEKIASGKDNKLSPQELAILPEAFRAVDADADGHLDVDELRQLLADPPTDLAVTVRLGRRKNDEPALEVKQVSRRSPPAGEIVRSADGARTLVFGKVRIELVSAPGPTYNRNLAETYKRLLKNFDTDNNGYLEEKEVARNQFRNSFDLIDRDADGKIFEQELVAYGKQMEAASASRTLMTATDQGNKLFQILDVNRDGRLSGRELAAAREKIPEWDDDGDAQISDKEIPRHWQVSLSRGAPVGAFGNVLVVDRPISASRPFRARNNAGPLWFRKMDRNTDGELTRREFLGKLADFQKMDSDKDNLIDADEAARFK